MHVGLLLAKMIVVLLGTILAFQGLRASRREDNSRMVFVGAGFMLLSIGSVLEGVFYDVLQLSVFVAGTIQTMLVTVGMVFILYSVYIPSDGGKRRPSNGGAKKK